MARITTAIRERVESILSSGVETVNADSLKTAKGPSDVRNASAFDGADGGEQIQNAIDDLPTTGGTVLIGAEGPDDYDPANYSAVSNVWLVSSPILHPSNVKLLLDGAYLIAEDGIDDNVIRSADRTDYGEYKRLIGDENATIDGNALGHSNRTFGEPDSEDCGINYIREDHVTVDGITIKRTNAYGLQIEDVYDLDVDVIGEMRGETNNQDIVHLNGCVGFDVKLRGTGGHDNPFGAVSTDTDDCLFHSSNGPILFGNVFADCEMSNDPSTQGIVKLLAGDGNRIRHIDVKVISTRSRGNYDTENYLDSLVTLGPSDFANTPPSTNEFEGISIEVVSSGQGSSTDGVNIVSPCQAIDIDLNGSAFNQGININDTVYALSANINVHGASNAIQFDENANVNGCDIHINGFNENASGQGILGSVTGGSCDNLTITGSIRSAQYLTSLTSSDISGVISGIDFGGLDSVGNSAISGELENTNIRFANCSPVDVTGLPIVQGSTAYNNGATNSPSGPAYSDGSNWISLVDGTTIV